MPHRGAFKISRGFEKVSQSYSFIAARQTSFQKGLWQFTMILDISLGPTKKSLSIFSFVAISCQGSILLIYFLSHVNLRPRSKSSILIMLRPPISKGACRICLFTACLLPLTLIGKIALIKTLMISKIIHILLSLPRPKEETFIRIENIFLKFMWLNKPPKFKTSTLENLTALGGLQFPNIRKIDMTMKASWIKRIYKTDEGWAATPIFYGLTKIYEYGDVFLERKNDIQNEFWKNVVQSVYFIYTNARIGSLEQVLSISYQQIALGLLSQLAMRLISAGISEIILQKLRKIL